MVKTAYLLFCFAEALLQMRYQGAKDNVWQPYRLIELCSVWQGLVILNIRILADIIVLECPFDSPTIHQSNPVIPNMLQDLMTPLCFCFNAKV